jgi:hypothetical protein
VTRAIGVPIALLFVLIVGTANSAGYRFGVSDQAFYIPAISLRTDPSLFPRDRDVFEPQMRLWLGDELLAAVVRTTDVELPTLFALLYVVTMVGLALAAIALARSLGCNWWTIAICLILLTLRHRIARTGANSLEGYMHPRMLAFACGLVALAFVTRLRPRAAAMWTLVAAVVHTSTAIWFAGVVLVAAAWPYHASRAARTTAVVLAGLGLAGLTGAAAFLPRMDEAWLAVLGGRDYLFSADWPMFAWVTNLAYPVVLYAIYRRRRAAGAAVPGETGLVVGLITLVAGFLLTLPIVEWHVAFFVQLQANRVFWLLDAVVAVYVAWWLAEDVMARWPTGRRAGAVALLALLAVGRGAFVLHETGRPLAQVAPAQDDWVDVMRWLRSQPISWHVLADPGHAWKYGVSVRAAALRDTPLEVGKDPAMAMYDRALATRVAERTAALGGFDTWSVPDDVRGIAARYAIDVFVDRADRAFPFPVLFRNDTFVVYDLR